MPDPDVWMVPSRSSDRSRENQPRPAANAVAGPAARVLSLQGTLGNRATCELLRSGRAPGTLLHRALRGKEDVVSGKGGRLSEQSGRQAIEDFARNDPRTVKFLEGEALELVRPERRGGRWKLDAQEWGLIRENVSGEVHLILGDKDGVQWGKYLAEGTPLAHSHPWMQGRGARETRLGWEIWGKPPSPSPSGPGAGGAAGPAGQPQPSAPSLSGPGAGDATGPAGQPQPSAPSPSGPGAGGATGPADQPQTYPATIPIDDLLREPGQRVSWARMMVLPSVSDFVFPARQGQTTHTVFTPYVIDTAGVIRDPGDQDAGARRLIWELSEIILDEANNQMTGRLTATAGGTTVRSYKVQSPTTDLKKTYYTIIA